MAEKKSKLPHGGSHRDDSSLDTLSRTLEELEQRLSQMATAKTTPRLVADTSPDTPSPARAATRTAPAARPAHTSRPNRPTLSEAVSQIVLRQQMLDRDRSDLSEGEVVRAPAPVAAASSRDDRAVSDISRDLERLRAELRDDMNRSLQTRFDDMRHAFDDLRTMIADRASAETIEAEIARVDDGLSRMADGGADHAAVRSLRKELEAMRGLVGEMAREETVKDLGRRWDAVGTEFNDRAEEDTRARRDLKDELERIRVSLGTLASEDHVKSVERRLDEFEARHVAVFQEFGEGGISEMLKTEMNGLRGKLETLASEKSMRAVEERWTALEDKFASREIEGKIEAMSGRMEQLEAALAKLPETLAIAPLEQRVHALAVGIEAIAKQQQDEFELDHFAQLEERLDEISRAIVSAASRAPAIDMSPVERIEARLQSLTARVDQLAEEGDTQVLSGRIGELSERIESLADGSAAADLAERIERFSTRLEHLMQASEGSSLEAVAIENRLQTLAEQIEAASASRVDDDLVRSLGAQIARLSDQIGEGGVPGAIADPELDERLADIERRLDENRDAIVASAKAAADEAIRQMLESGDLRQGEHVARLSEDLRSLEALSRQTGEQSQEFFKTVHATLIRLVERIDTIDSEMSRRTPAQDDGEASAQHARHVQADPQAAAVAVPHTSKGLRGLLSRKVGAGRQPANADAASAGRATAPRHDDDPELMVAEFPGERGGALRSVPPVEAPSLDAADIFESDEANRPLAIGSGTPDIAALLQRVRAQQAGQTGEADEGGRADFIAAARRAAMAAASEAEGLRSGETGNEEDGGKGGVTDFISRRRKPILMAIGAVLLALMALPLGQVLNSSTDGAELVADANAPERLAPQAATAPLVASKLPDDAPASPTEATDSTAGSPAPAKTATTETRTAEAGSETPDGLLSPAALSPDTFGPNAMAGDSAARTAPAKASDTLISRSLTGAPGSADFQTTSADVAAAGAAAASTSVGPLPPMPEEIGTEALKVAAGEGDPKAIFEIGLRLMEGRDTDPQPAVAAKWFQNSAERGFAPAQYSLGTLYEKGNGVARDTVAARDWYLKAAEQGNIRAMHNLAVLFATGVDGKSEPKLAAQWFERAAEHGMTDSQYNLGILYARGAGVEQDLTESYKWFSVVAKAGDNDAGRKRDEVAKSLTPERLKEAEAKLASFTAKPRDEAVNTVDVPAAWTDGTAPMHTSSVDMKRAIRNIQAILIKLGYEPGAPDGVVGEQTTAAIKSFQKEAGLTPDGSIDETLIRALLARKDG
ncbi:peptidoglycan-binding protein [Aurantimonas sp. A2-1-M11]|uniref:peptidoglycan-binding protein n=1 Tax=Aurantimonas sp. A2-1-M11 TaxID=3113712 RepID=UPI002F942E9A